MKRTSPEDRVLTQMGSAAISSLSRLLGYERTNSGHHESGAIGPTTESGACVAAVGTVLVIAESGAVLLWCRAVVRKNAHRTKALCGVAAMMTVADCRKRAHDCMAAARRTSDRDGQLHLAAALRCVAHVC